MAISKWFFYLPPLWPLIPFAYTIDLLTPKSPSLAASSGPDRNTIDDFDLPTADEDRIVPEIYGTVELSPNLIAIGDLVAKKIKKAGQTVGYRYDLPMVWAIGTEIDAFVALKRNKDDIYTGIVDVFPATILATTGEKAKINGSNSKKHENTVLDGKQTTTHPLLLEITGDDIAYVGTSLLIMAYHDEDDDFKGAFIGDNVSNVPPYSVVVRRIKMLVEDDVSWGSTHNIAESANPAHVIYDIMVNKNLTDPALIDKTNFQTVAQDLYDEGTGISFAMQDFKSAKEWIGEIERHIDCAMYFDEVDGKFKLKLIRADYDPDDLLTFDKSDFRDFTEKVSTWANVNTEFQIKYISPTKNYEETSTGWIINPAARDNLGFIKPETISLPMFTHATPVKLAAARFQRRLFYPLKSGQFRIPKANFPINRGFAFKIDTEDYTGLIVRCTAIEGVDRKEQTVEVSWLEDIWGIGDIDIADIQDGDAPDPDPNLDDPVLFPRVVDALPELAAEKSLMTWCARPATGAALGYEVSVNGGDTIGDYDFSATGLMNGTYSGPEWLDRDGTFDIDTTIDFTAFDQTEEEWQAGKKVMILDKGTSSIDYEIVLPKKLEDLGGGSWRVTGLIRGMFGTPMQTYADNTRVWILPMEAVDVRETVSDISELSAIELAASIDVEFVPFNLSGTGPETIVPHTYGFLPETPYLVANLTSELVLGDAVVAWDARRRQSDNTLANVQPDGSTPLNSGFSEGSFEIVDGSGFGPVYPLPTFYVRDTAPTPRTYTVKSVYVGRKSAGTDTTI